MQPFHIVSYGTCLRLVTGGVSTSVSDHDGPAREEEEGSYHPEHVRVTAGEISGAAEKLRNMEARLFDHQSEIEKASPNLAPELS